MLIVTRLVKASATMKRKKKKGRVGIKRKQSLVKIASDGTFKPTIDPKDNVISKLHAAIARANKEQLSLENAT